MLSLTVLLPPKARQVGEWIIVELPCHYERQESSKSKGLRRRAGSEEERKKKEQ